MDSERCDQITQQLAALGVCWLAFRPAELVMALGYLPCWGNSMCLWAPDGARTLYIPELEPDDLLPVEVECRRFPWGVLSCSDPWTELLELIRSDARGRGLTRLPLAWREATSQTALPMMCAESPPMDGTFPARLASEVFAGRSNAESEITRLFILKTKREVERIRLANEVAAKGIEAFFASLVPGATDAEIAARVESAIMAQMKNDGIGHARGWAMVQSGMESAHGGTYSRTTGRTVRAGEGVLLELATCVDGYYSDLTRVGTVGAPHGAWIDAVALVREAQKLAVAAIKPGVACSEIDRAARSFLNHKGVGRFFTHATGHQVGFHYHDPGPALAPGSSAVLESGMVVTVEPGIYLPDAGFGVRIEDNFLVTPSGGEILSAASTGGHVEVQR